MIKKCKESLLKRKINPRSTIEYEINSEIHTLSLEWIIEAFLQTHKRDLFIEMLENVLKGKDLEIEQFFQQMGQLILMSSLSKEEIEEKL